MDLVPACSWWKRPLTPECSSGWRWPGRADDGAGAPVPGLVRVTGVAVHPTYRGQGLGGRLMDAVIDHARDVDATRVTLWVDADNAVGQRLFGSRGFLATGRTQRDESGGELLHYAHDL